MLLWHCDSRYWHIDIDHSQMRSDGAFDRQCAYRVQLLHLYDSTASTTGSCRCSLICWILFWQSIYFFYASSLINQTAYDATLQVCSEINLKLKLASQVTINDSHSTIPEILPFYHPSVASLNPITKNHKIQFHSISLQYMQT